MDTLGAGMLSKKIGRAFALLSTLSLLATPVAALDASRLPDPALSLDTSLESAFKTGPISLRRILASSILTRLSAAQVADVRSGAGTLDLAPTLNAALNTCMPGLPAPSITFSAGVYGLASELVVSTCGVHIILEAGAVLKQIAPFVSGASQKNFGLIRIEPAAAGSSIRGPGTINGNRGALVDAYLATPRSTQGNGLYVQRDMWNCVHINAAADVTVEGVRFKGCMTFAVAHFAGDRAQIKDIVVTDSSAILNALSNYNSSYTNISGYRIGNAVNGNAIPGFTYPFGVGDCYSCGIDNIRIKNAFYLAYDGTATTAGSRIGDPYTAGFSFQRLHDTVIGGLSASDFSTTLPGQSAPDARATNAGWSIICDNCANTTINGIATRGYYWGAVLSGSRLSFDNYNLDGEYNITAPPGTDTSYGIRTLPGGQIRALYNSDSTYDHYAQKNTDEIAIGTGSVTRFGDGLSVQSSNVTINGVRANGNAFSGISLWANTKNGSYPGSNVYPVANVVIGTATARFNGGGGLVINTGTNVRAGTLDLSNNGQNPSLGVAAGLFLNGGFGGTKSKITVTDWTADDTQGDAIAATASFAPGTSAGRWKIVVTDSSAIAVGQRVLLKAAGASGADITAKVVDITDDFVTVSTPSGTVFDGSGCSTAALAGTLSVPANTNLVSGVGTAFATAINGPIYLKVAGGYYKVGAVTSDTQLQIDNVPASAISGATATVMKCGLQGIKSQQYGAFVPAASDISNVDLGPAAGRRAKGNVTQDILAAPASLADDWTPYTAAISFPDGSGVTVGDRLSSYRQEGTNLCIRGYAQITYTTAPTLFSVGLPSGFTVGAQGGSAVGANTATRNRLLGAAINGDTGVSMIPLSGALATASGQYAQFGGCFALR